MSNEIWKPVVGFEGYEVSNLGRLRSLKRKKPHIFELEPNNWGYYSAHLNGRHCIVHRLVAEAFIPNPENKPIVNHINGIKTDNRVENLEWCTQSENCLHAIKIGLTRRNGKHKLTDEQVLFIRENTDISNVELAKMFNVCRDTISFVRRGKSYRRVQRRPKVKLEPVTVAPLQVGFIIDCKIAFAPLHNCSESTEQLFNRS